MQNVAIAKLIEEFKALSISEREKFIGFISANSSPSDFKFIVDTKLTDGIVCPHCSAKGKGVRKSGYQKNGRPRFHCSHCNILSAQRPLPSMLIFMPFSRMASFLSPDVY